MSNSPFEMRFDPRTIKHLGVRMYSTLPPAIAEVIANAYDADASQVTVTLREKDDTPAEITVCPTGPIISLPHPTPTSCLLPPALHRKQHRIIITSFEPSPKMALTRNGRRLQWLIPRLKASGADSHRRHHYFYTHTLGPLARADSTALSNAATGS